jgi:hypothetical protein
MPITKFASANGRENQGDLPGDILTAQEVGNPGGKQTEYNQKPELGIPWPIES